jgi:hypothetical protein
LAQVRQFGIETLLNAALFLLLVGNEAPLRGHFVLVFGDLAAQFQGGFARVLLVELHFRVERLALLQQFLQAFAGDGRHFINLRKRCGALGIVRGLVRVAREQGAVAAALLVVGSGGLGALQTAAVITALPFSLVMVGMAVSTVRAFHREHHARLRREQALQLEAVTQHVTTRLTNGAPVTDRR